MDTALWGADLVVLIASLVATLTVYDTGRRNGRLVTRFTSRLIEERTMNFLSYMTEVFSGGEATTLLDELIRYYTRSKVSEGERGSDTVRTVLKRLDPIVGEISSLLEKAKDIEKVTELEEKVASDHRISYALCWVSTVQGSLLLASVWFSLPDYLRFALYGTWSISICLAVAFQLRSRSTVAEMQKEASTRIRSAPRPLPSN